MRKLILIALLWGAVASATTPTVRKSTQVFNSKYCYPTCTLNITPATPGDLLILGYIGYVPAQQFKTVVDNKSASWTTGCWVQNTDASMGTSLAYITSAQALSSITVTLNTGDSAANFVLVEYSGGPFALNVSCMSLPNTPGDGGYLYTPVIPATGPTSVVVSIIIQQDLNNWIYSSSDVHTIWGPPWGSGTILGTPGQSGGVYVDAIGPPGSYYASFASGETNPYSSVALAFSAPGAANPRTRILN